ncbi:MAG: winged helix DNA-binding protein [Propionibacteriales bacterium]|nr:winged helix DNA-binding protein [Propionibacteriales bacterium]
MRTRGSRHHHPDDSTGLVLWQVTNGWQAAQRAVLVPLGLTHAQFVALASITTLTDAEERVNQSRVNEYARLDPTMGSQVVRALESKGLIVRQRDSADRRARLLSPTESGRRLAAAAIRVVEGVDDRFFEAIADDRREFTRHLVSIRDATR